MLLSQAVALHTHSLNKCMCKYPRLESSSACKSRTPQDVLTSCQDFVENPFVGLRGCWQLQGAPQLPQQASKQLPQQLPHHLLQLQAPQHLTQQPADSGWTYRLKSATLPQESRQDDSLAAYQSLLNEEAQRMLSHASADGTQYSARSLLRTPHHLVPLVEACKTLQGLQSLDLSMNALADAALLQLQHLVQAGVQLTSLDLSNNNLSSHAAAPLCSIISHVSSPRPQSHGPSQQPPPHLAAHSSASAAERTAGVESPASAPQNLPSASQDSLAQDRTSAAFAASGGLESDSGTRSAPAAPSREGGTEDEFGSSLSRSGGDASTSGPEPATGLSAHKALPLHLRQGRAFSDCSACVCPLQRKTCDSLWLVMLSWTKRTELLYLPASHLAFMLHVGCNKK